MKRQDKHHEFQKAFIHHCGLNEGRFPLLKALYAVPNGGLRDKVTAAKMKAEGQRKGVWDLNLPVRRVQTFSPLPVHLMSTIGLWIEIKIGRDQLTPEQIAWRELLEPLGHEFYIARDTPCGMQRALEYVIGYLGGEL